MKRVFLALSLLFAVSLACKSPQCGSILTGFRAEPGFPTNCSLIDINVNTAHLFRRVPFDGCTDNKVRTTGVPEISYQIDGGYLFWVSGRGANVYKIDASMAYSTIWGTLPSTYDYIFGINYGNSQGLYVATTSELLFMADLTTMTNTAQSVMSFSSFQFSSKTVMAGDEWDVYLYIVDEATIVTLDVTTPTAPIIVSRVKMNGLAFPSAVQVYASSSFATNQLLLLVGNTYYIVDPATGLYKSVGTIAQPVGGITSVALVYDGVYYSDYADLFWMDLTDGNVTRVGAFEGATMAGPFLGHA